MKISVEAFIVVTMTGDEWRDMHETMIQACSSMTTAAKYFADELKAQEETHTKDELEHDMYKGFRERLSTCKFTLERETNALFAAAAAIQNQVKL